MEIIASLGLSIFVVFLVATFWKQVSQIRTVAKEAPIVPVRASANQTTVDMDPLTPHYLFLDLETTGLDPLVETPIEVAAILTDKHFREITRYHGVIAIDPEAIPFMSEWCQKTHGESGLLNECVTSETDSIQVFDGLVEVLEAYGAKNLVLAGNSVHFDRSFLKVHASQVMEYLHYRNLDITSVLAIFQGTPHEIPRAEAVAHRAMADIEWSLETARGARRHLTSL